MSNNIIKFVTSDKRPLEAAAIEAGEVFLLPADQHRVIDAYFAGETDQSTELSLACDRLGVPADVNCSRLAAGAGQILIQGIQEELPQWSTSKADGRIVFGRKLRDCSKRARLALAPVYLFTINWADSGPGFSWPETYTLVYVPWHERFVVIASQDGDDVWGCSDQAIGHFSRKERRLVGARKIISNHWRAMSDDGQSPWAYLFNTGLVDTETAERWRKQVWPRGEEGYR